MGRGSVSAASASWTEAGTSFVSAIESPFGYSSRVGVGIMVAHNPLHRSGRAGFPHPAPASGDDAKSPQGIGVADVSGRQVAVNESPHPIPEDPALLASPRQRTMPEPAHLEPKHVECRAVHGHTVVPDMSTDNRAQPLAHLGDRVVHASPELGFPLAQLRLQPLTDRLPNHREPSIAPLLPADVRETEEVERLGLPLSAPPSVFGSEWPEFQKTRLLGMQLQSELPKSFDKLCPEPLGVRFALESNHDVVRKPHDDHVAAGLLPSPCLHPE